MSTPSRSRPAVLAAAALVAFAAAAPAASPAEHLDADQAVRRALEVSHATAAAAARTTGTQARLDAAGAAARPVLGATATVAERSSVPELKLAPGGPGSPVLTLYPDIRTTYAFGLGLSQALYTGGAVTANREAARRTLVASRADDRLTRAGVAFSARRTYWQAAATAADVDNARADVERASRLLTDTRSMLEAGMAVKADVLSAQAREAAARLRLIRAQAAADDALAALRSLLQIPAGTSIGLAGIVPAGLPPRPAPLDELQREAREQRPELASLHARVGALGYREHAAAAPSRPSVSAMVQWDLARPNQRYFPLQDTWHDSWSVGLAAGWTLWDGGRTRAGVATARAELEVARQDLAEQQRTVELDVDEARRALDSALSAVDAAETSWQAAQAREQAVKERYEAGLATISDVLDAQAGLAGAETDRVTTRANAWIADARLTRAVGR